MLLILEMLQRLSHLPYNPLYKYSVVRIHQYKYDITSNIITGDHMVPKIFLSKMGNYVVDINSTKITVKVADSAEAIDEALGNQLSNFFVYNVFGLDYKTAVSLDSSCSRKLLVLCAGDDFGYCSLVVQLDHLDYQVSEKLKKILTNPDKCFVMRASYLPNLFGPGDASVRSIKVGAQ
ncbi:hypothetical protein RND81_04G225900 [Saponaria officinalis]|uniref:Uncharacterized protein n=1 Tax=Saponaria officinalis TaxID=3572 RepID=A0AAW1LPR1_SAPOF